MQNQPTEFQTRNLQIGSALKAAGQRLVRLDWRDGKAHFVFEDKLRCESMVQDYWSSGLKLPAKDFFNSMRELKDRLFQAERDGCARNSLRKSESK